MEVLFALIDFSSLLNILYVAIGLTFVILFHELGHFAVAKWCDVQVERFSIGFGPILLRFKKGETEYALSAIPFGGYVKMLGQDDTDPSQMSAEEIAQDPRSYSSKSVLQRMGIISAGVIMNVATGLLFFAGGFSLGVEEAAPYVGHVAIGLPAWEAGIQVGDEITYVNGRKVDVFSDLSRAVALSAVDSITVEGIHPDGTPYKTNVHLDSRSTRPRIGVGETMSLDLIDVPGQDISVTLDGSAAAAAEPPFKPGDTIVRVGDRKLETFPELQNVLARKRAETVHFIVRRKGETETVDIPVEPRRFRSLGLWMSIGPVTAIKRDSPAVEAGLQEDDVIIAVDGQDAGSKINPLQLPDYFASKAGEPVEVVIQRPEKGSDPRELTLTIVPQDKPGWTERPQVGQPVSIPAIGAAFQLTSTVVHVVEGSPADGKINREQRIRKMELFLPQGAESDLYGKEPLTIEFDQQKGENSETVQNWAYAFWALQSVPNRHVRLYVNAPGDGGKNKDQIVQIEPQVVDESWYLPVRGIRMMPLLKQRKAESFGEALAMGWTHTKNNVIDIYLTLRSLFGGRISVKELHGPIGIATVAYRVVSLGLPKFLLFLGFLSVNLAVINFLPIPVLDGGHMVFLIWEAVTRKKPSERILIAATYAGMAVVLGLMMLVLYLDIFVHWLPGQ